MNIIFLDQLITFRKISDLQTVMMTALKKCPLLIEFEFIFNVVKKRKVIIEANFYTNEVVVKAKKVS